MGRYCVSKRMEIAGSHQLSLDYESPCSHIHGHNWVVTVFCRSNATQSLSEQVLDQNGMVVDFALLKKNIHGKLDHKHINHVIPGINPTAENIAKWIMEEATKCCRRGECYKVIVQESEGNIAMYSLDEEDCL